MTDYKPKVGERVRLLSSPDPRDSAAVGLTFTIRSACATHDPCAYWVTEERFPWIHRDAVWEPVATQEPTAEPAQPEASDPIATLRRYVDEVFRDEGVSCNQYQRTVEALGKVERDRAAHAATKENLRRVLLCEAEQDAEIERLRGERDKYCGELGRLTVAHAAEVERLRGELAEAKTKADRLEALWITDARHLKAELSKARAERTMPSDEELAIVIWEATHGLKWGTPAAEARPYRKDPACYLLAARAAKAALLGVRREVVAPTFEEVYGALKGTARRALSDQTRAVLALFGAEPKGQPEPAPAPPPEMVGKVVAGLCSDVAKLRDWQRHIEAHHQPADHSKRLSALERAVEGLKGAK